MKKILLLLLLSLSLNTFATVGTGTYVADSGKYQDDDTGSADNFQFNPSFAANHMMHVWATQYFMPEIGVAFHRNLQDEYTKRTYYILYNFAWRFIDTTFFRYGFGTFMTRIKGEGGTATLRNGSGTATFYKPSGTTTSYNTTINLGIEHFFIKHVTGRFDTYVSSFLNSDSMALNYALTANYYY